MQINNKPYIPILCMIAAVMSLLSCKKETPPKYSGEDFLYFQTKKIPSIDVTNINGIYYPVKSFSFLTSQYQMDTLQMNTLYDFDLAIRTDGRLSDKDRPVLMEVEGNGAAFAVLPHPDSIYIKANGVEYTLNLKLARPPLSDTGTKTLTLILKSNHAFKPERHTWNKVTYVFGNLLTEPQFYYMELDSYGAFSSAKMVIMQEAVNRKGAAYWQTDPDITILNNYINLQGAKPLNFDPFTYSDLYNFIDLYLVLYNIPSGPLRDAFNNANAKFIELSKELLIERKNAGNPVVDGSGKEISFP